MAIDFPSSPLSGEFYPALPTPNVPQWKWNGSGWARVANAGQVASVFFVFQPVEDAVQPFPFLVSNNFQTFTYL